MPSIGHVPRVAPARTAPSSATPQPGLPCRSSARVICSASCSSRSPARRSSRTPSRSRSTRCTGARSVPRAPAARARRRACPPSRTCSTSASTTAASGAPPTTAPTGSDLRRPVHRLHRRHRGGSVEPERDLCRDRRRDHPSRPLDRRRHVQVGRCRKARGSHLGLRETQMIAASMSIRGIPTGCSSRRSGTRTAPTRSAACSAPPTGADVREGALQGRVHERERCADRSLRSRTSSTRRSGSSSRASSRGRGSAAMATGIFKSTDGGTTWKQLTERLPSILQANIAVSPSNPRTLYAMIAGTPKGSGPHHRAHRLLQVHRCRRTLDQPVNVSTRIRPGCERPTPDTRPLARIGGGDLPTLTVDPKNENVVYSATVVMWRTEDAGLTGRRCAAHRAATTIRRSGSTRTTPTSFSRSPTRALSSRRTAASRGATGTTSPPPRCTT
jgi:hypothetical protein